MDEDGFRVTIAAAKAGEPRAFAALVRMLEGPLVGYLNARGSEDPELHANEVLVNVFRSIDRFDGNGGQFRAFVFTAARNRLIDEYRYRGRRPSTTPLPPEEFAGRGDMRDDTEPGADIESNEAVDELLASLTPDQREVVVLRIVAGLSVEETATVVGRQPGAVRALQHRAIRHLRQNFRATA